MDTINMDTINGFLEVKLNKKRDNDGDDNNKKSLKRANTSSSVPLSSSSSSSSSSSTTTTTKVNKHTLKEKEKKTSDGTKKIYKYNCIHGKRKYDCPACYTSKKKS